MLCGLIYMIFWKLQNCKDRNQTSRGQGLGLGRGFTTKGHEEIYGGDELFYNLIVVTVTQLYFKNHRTEGLKG